jgi:hypothetical protein
MDIVKAGRQGETGLPELLPQLVDEQLLDEWLARQGLTIEELRRGGRDPFHLAARRHAAQFLRRRGWSYPMIGRHLDRDNASIQNLVKGKPRRRR